MKFNIEQIRWAFGFARNNWSDMKNKFWIFWNVFFVAWSIFWLTAAIVNSGWTWRVPYFSAASVLFLGLIVLNVWIGANKTHHETVIGILNDHSKTPGDRLATLKAYETKANKGA